MIIEETAFGLVQNEFKRKCTILKKKKVSHDCESIALNQSYGIDGKIDYVSKNCFTSPVVNVFIYK